MARIFSAIQFTGRVGGIVGVIDRNGQFHLRRYQPIVANPRTPAQMRNRAKLRLASQWTAMLGEVGRTALVANGYNPTDRGQLVSRLMQHVKVNDDGSQASLPYDLQLVDHPSRVRAMHIELTDEGSTFRASFSGAQAGDRIAKCILVHDLSAHTWRHTSTLDGETTLSFAKNATEATHAIEVIAYGIALIPKASKESKITNSTYLFSPSACAVLNVA